MNKDKLDLGTRIYGEVMVLIYFASPLFSEAERAFNTGLTERLEQANFEVFLPQRDGAEPDKPPYDRMSRDERRQAMFDLDKRRIFECAVFLFVLDGRVPDEGACSNSVLRTPTRS